MNDFVENDQAIAQMKTRLKRAVRSEDLPPYLESRIRYQGRKFIHVSLKNESRLVSLVIAGKADGESFRTEELIPALAQSGISYYRAGVQRFEVASVESQDHLVYLVSDLPQKENMRFMLAIAPDVKEFLRTKES